MATETDAFILLGEDDHDDQELLKEVFETVDSKLRLAFVNDGPAVLSFLQKLPEDKLPCLIVLDYNMPGMSGADILAEIGKHERFKNIPKVIWSTSASENFKKKGLELGASDYVIKPSSIKEMEQVSRYLLSLCA